jgi:hypothetical protein
MTKLTSNATKALRSLVRLAKKRGLISTNPTIGLKARPVDFVLLPMSDMEIDAVEQLAAAPAERVIIALAAENAARTGTIRHVTLDEVDLANRRIILGGRRQRLGDLSAIRRILRTQLGWAPDERTLQRNFHRLGLTTAAAAGSASVFGRFEAAAPNDL